MIEQIINGKDFCFTSATEALAKGSVVVLEQAFQHIAATVGKDTDTARSELDTVLSKFEDHDLRAVRESVKAFVADAGFNFTFKS